MKETVRKGQVTKLFKYIYGLKDKCDSINDINKNLITEYCRFAVINQELSQQMLCELDCNDPGKISALIDSYSAVNKILINLYKTLRFDSIKDELKDEKNPFLALAEEMRKNDDL